MLPSKHVIESAVARVFKFHVIIVISWARTLITAELELFWWPSVKMRFLIPILLFLLVRFTPVPTGLFPSLF